MVFIPHLFPDIVIKVVLNSDTGNGFNWISKTCNRTVLNELRNLSFDIYWNCRNTTNTFVDTDCG